MINFGGMLEESLMLVENVKRQFMIVGNIVLDVEKKLNGNYISC